MNTIELIINNYYPNYDWTDCTVDFLELPDDIDDIHFLIECRDEYVAYPKKEKDSQECRSHFQEEEIHQQPEKIDINKLFEESRIVSNYDEVLTNEQTQPGQTQLSNNNQASSSGSIRLTSTKDIAKTTQPLRQPSNYSLSRYPEQSYRTFSKKGKLDSLEVIKSMPQKIYNSTPSFFFIYQISMFLLSVIF